MFKLNALGTFEYLLKIFLNGETNARYIANRHSQYFVHQEWNTFKITKNIFVIE